MRMVYNTIHNTTLTLLYTLITLKTLIIQKNNRTFDTHRQNISFYRKKHSPSEHA